jgi:hypothetical protein
MVKLKSPPISAPAPPELFWLLPPCAPKARIWSFPCSAP